MADIEQGHPLRERVARAICFADSDYQYCAENCKDSCAGEIDDFYLSQADAAIATVMAALSEPSEPMLHFVSYSSLICQGDIKEVFRNTTRYLKENDRG